jgi:hypothetical protein
MDQLAGEAVAAGPVGQDRCLLIARGHDELWRSKLAVGGVEPPVVISALDPLDARAELELDPVLVGVPVEMLDELVPRSEHRGALRELPARQVRERPAGIEAKAVIPGAPRRRHLVRLVRQKRAQATVLEGHGSRYARGSRADHHDLTLDHVATITPPARAVRACP